MATSLYSIPTMKQARTFLILISLFAWLPIHASADTFSCPQYVTASSANVVEVPTPWKVYSQSNKLKVVSAGFSDGQPFDMAYLKPYRTHQKGNLTIVRWKFEGPYPKGKWLSCDYEGGLFSLARELPNNLSECVVTYEKTKAGNTQPSSITCK
jgi:hypothetical protein